ncbi:hypothetical protein V6N11_042622 [Hibiscus sabdariffa]|uniref:Uncharacterized protein n=1 Tax=Hibiscus sabdariffa TaxID=183260 RepID=A0ABR2QWV8_9ROSI
MSASSADATVANPRKPEILAPRNANLLIAAYPASSLDFLHLMRENPSLPLEPSPYENLGGRPPELAPAVDFNPVRERPTTHTLEDHRTTEKGKNGGEDDVWVESSAMDANFECRNTLKDKVEIQEKSTELGDGNHDASKSKSTSYASVVSEGRKTSMFGVVDGFVGDSVDILAEDIIINCDAVIPSIQISDRAHDQIDHNMPNAIIDTLVAGTTKRVDESVEVSESNLYGPWMVVENRRRRVGQTYLANKNASHGADGSRFSVLQDVDEVRVDGSVEDGSTLVWDVVYSPVQQQDTARRMQQVQASGMTRTESYLVSNHDRKSKARRKSKGSTTTVPLQNNSGATIVHHQATIPSGSHQAVRIIEGAGHDQPLSASTSQGKKVVVTTLAKHLSEQLDDGDLPDGLLVGADRNDVMEHSSNDDVAFLA